MMFSRQLNTIQFKAMLLNHLEFSIASRPSKNPGQDANSTSIFGLLKKYNNKDINTLGFPEAITNNTNSIFQNIISHRQFNSSTQRCFLNK